MKILRYLLLGVLLPGLFLHHARGQSNPHIDSLLNLLTTAKQDTNRIKVYGQLCWIYASTRDKLDSARIFADSIYSISNKLKEERGLIYAHFYYGVIDRHEGNLASSLDHFEKYVDYHKKNGNTRLVATGLYQVGVIHKSMGNYDESLSAFYEVLNIHENNGYQYGIGFTLNAMGGIQRTFGNYPDAVASFQRAIRIFSGLNETSDLSMSMENLGNVFAEMNLFDSALYYYNGALDIDRKLNKKFGIASELENLGSLYLNKGNYQQALNYQLESLEIRRQLPQKRELAMSLIKTGKIYGIMQLYREADDYLFQGMELAREIKARPYLMEGYRELALLYELKNEFDQAYEYQKKFIQLKDSIFNEEKIKQITDLEARYKTTKKDQQITLLAKENEIKEAKVKQQAILRNALLGIIMLIAALAGMVFYSSRQKLKNQKIISEKNEELKISKYQRQLTELEMKALRSQMNPHFIFNCMNSINRMILSGDNEEASMYLNKFSKLIRLTLENSEQSLITLEDELDMVEAYIQLESIRFKDKIHYQITIDESIDPSSIHLPSMVLQPFIENAIWHGLMHKDAPGHIHIKISEESDELKCIIEDDGVGREMALKFKDRENKNKSMGLKITEERLKLIGKEKLRDWIRIVDLKDSLNRASGTRVDISIPII